MMRQYRKVLLSSGISIVSLVILETALRLCGFPHGTFAPFFPHGPGLYPENASMLMTWGPVPYVVRSNSLGLRGEEISSRKPPGATRVVTVGDSVTDGFFVDNEDTWQYRLSGLLKGRLAQPIEIINCASGGGSVDRELGLLEEFGLPLQPDVVILTFSANDIAEILGKREEDLLTRIGAAPDSGLARMQRLLLTRTALGEAMYGAYLLARSSSYRHGRKMVGRSRDERYLIAGGNEFQNNAEISVRRFARTDGLVLGGVFDPRTKLAIDVYGRLLARFVSQCRKNGVRPVLVYFPAYSQIYLDGASLLINVTLRDMCLSEGVDFLDLTPGFREKGAGRVLHLAPLDFHLNPEGNRVFAELVAEGLFPLLVSGRQ